MNRVRTRMLRDIPAVLPIPGMHEPSLHTDQMEHGPSSVAPKRRALPANPKEIKVPVAPKPKRPRTRMARDIARAATSRELRYRRPGRPFFEPTEAQREMVKTGIANGIYHKELRKLIINPDTGKPIDKEIFRQAFHWEIRNGYQSQKLATSMTAYQMAVGTDARYDDEGNLIRPAVEPNISALKWYEMSRFGLKEGTQIVMTGPDGKPLPQGEQQAQINIGQVIFMMPKNGYETRDPKDITPQVPQIEAQAEEVLEDANS